MSGISNHPSGLRYTFPPRATVVRTKRVRCFHAQVLKPTLRLRAFRKEPLHRETAARERECPRVTHVAGRLIASNPISKEMEIELGDLSTIGPVTFDDTVSGVAEFTAEARIDPQTGEWVNAAARFGPMPEYDRHLLRRAN